MISGLVVIDIFYMDVDMAHIHANHFFNGTGDLLLHIAADFTDVDILLENQMQINEDHIFLGLNTNAFAGSLFKEAINSTWNRCQPADAGHTQRREARDGGK